MFIGKNEDRSNSEYKYLICSIFPLLHGLCKTLCLNSLDKQPLSLYRWSFFFLMKSIFFFGGDENNKYPHPSRGSLFLSSLSTTSSIHLILIPLTHSLKWAINPILLWRQHPKKKEPLCSWLCSDKTRAMSNVIFLFNVPFKRNNKTPQTKIDRFWACSVFFKCYPDFTVDHFVWWQNFEINWVNLIA